MSFSCKLISPILFLYALYGAWIEQCSSLRDSNVTFDNQSTFKDHIRSISCSVMRAPGPITRMIRNSHMPLRFVRFCLTHIRSRLEYAFVICSFVSSNYPLNAEIEKAKRKFLRIYYADTAKILCATCTAVFFPLNIPLLLARRPTPDTIFLHKLLSSTCSFSCFPLSQFCVSSTILLLPQAALCSFSRGTHAEYIPFSIIS